MTMMNISLPDSLKAFIDQQVSQHGYDSSGDYVRDLIRKDQDRVKLQALLTAGANSVPLQEASQAYFDDLRRLARDGAKPGARE